ncbi:hypothetical protein ACWT_5861 [Actinoplanes sp. SE50]|uniref:hypothetical protein n=1 Tax=unclassified Actinoplanes TaxID=2626549 RepID=UPI00023EBDD1|nr:MULTISPECIES: hypothetical protein [unclassified Actinoplanes]AEV86879.1 hypothetical protein ACPL_5992 [Actinoplanes sp. SE50/110]ATO85276.1 hypothetical protein ACWT_5861 [Actinoplanes sp. SE50]SLM02686.1 hypothetical protein ACSP50_5968 [Actinoplanes sp. SE50/110]
MTARILTLKPSQMQRLRQQQHVWWDDSTGREVLVRTDPGGRVDTYPGALVLTLTPADLDLIETPDGLVCADETRTTGWTVCMAEVQA